MVPSERHHFQDLAVTPRPALCRSGPPCAHPSTSRGLWPPSVPGTLAHTRTRSRTHARARRDTHDRTPAARPLLRLRAQERLQGSATEACRVGVAQTPCPGSARPPGACRRLPCSPWSMSEPPRSRRSARRAPPRRSALRPPAAASAVPTPGVGAALRGTGPGRHRPPDRNLCAPPRRRGRCRRTGSQKVRKGRGGLGGEEDTEATQAAVCARGVCTSPASLRQESFLPGF